jgi:hypothetical protein
MSQEMFPVDKEGGGIIGTREEWTSCTKWQIVNWYDTEAAQKVNLKIQLLPAGEDTCDIPALNNLSVTTEVKPLKTKDPANPDADEAYRNVFRLNTTYRWNDIASVILTEDVVEDTEIEFNCNGDYPIEVGELTNFGNWNMMTQEIVPSSEKGSEMIEENVERGRVSQWISIDWYA